MKELSLQELKEIELETLKMFRDFCNENGISYFLSNGTLLGAVKYKGFIPWDDDIDVFVPRDDYDRMLALFKDNDRYKLFAFEKNEKYPYPFAKLCDMRTYKEQTIYKNRDVKLGVEMDIFPLDAWNNDYEQAKLEVKKINNYIKLLKLTKLEEPLTKNPLKRVVWAVIIAFLKLLGSKCFVKKILRITRNRPDSEHCYLGCKSWCIYGEREIVPANVFEDSVEVEFEGEKFNAPVGFDTYLRMLYGDYENDPPIDKQKTHHAFVAYWL